jgi:hypothetical protein
MSGWKQTRMKTQWWKPKNIVFKGTTFYSIDPFEPYDPFAHYYPHSLKQTTRLTKSLCYQFLNLNSDDPESVTGFCRQYGVLGRLDNPGWIIWGKEKSGLENFLTALGLDEASPMGFLYEHDERGARLRKIEGEEPDTSLCVPMEWGDFRIAQRQFREAAEWVSLVANKKRVKTQRSDIQIALSERFRWKLSMARPYLSPDSDTEQWALAWDIGSLEAAMYLMLLSDLHGGGVVRHCARCGSLFLGTTDRTRFCSPRCLSADKVRRFRAKQRESVSS